MSAQTDLLKTHATTIKNEVADGANTATRVGGAILEAANILETHDATIATLQTGVAGAATKTELNQVNAAVSGLSSSKADATALAAEETRAKAAEQANADEIATLGSKQDELEERIIPILGGKISLEDTIEVKEYDKFIGSTLSIESSADYFYSKPIAVKGGCEYTYYGKGYSTSIAMICECDANGNSRVLKVRSDDSTLKEYKYTPSNDGYIVVSGKSNIDYKLGHIEIYESKIESIENDISDIKDFISIDGDKQKDVETVSIPSATENSNILLSSQISGGNTIKVTIPQGSGKSFGLEVYNADGVRLLYKEVLSPNYQVTFVLPNDYYRIKLLYNTISNLVITNLSYVPVDKLKYSNKKLENRVSSLEEKQGGSNFSGLNVLWFGDSLVASSSKQVTKGFVELIADRNGCSYESYKDNNTPPASFNNKHCFKNIACDGTTLRHKDSSSIYDRVKSYVSDNNVDIVIIQGGTNDFNESFGEITSGYSDEYNANTTIGALESMFKHCIDKGVRVGYLIMHKVAYIADNYYDPMMEVCNKWGIPYINLTKSAGFYMVYSNSSQAKKYSILTTDYLAFDISKTYNLDDLVNYNGVNYKCKENGVVGKLPTDTTYWINMGTGECDFCHLSNLGHKVIAGKIEQFVKSLI